MRFGRQAKRKTGFALTTGLAGAIAACARAPAQAPVAPRAEVSAPDAQVAVVPVAAAAAAPAEASGDLPPLPPPAPVAPSPRALLVDEAPAYVSAFALATPTLPHGHAGGKGRKGRPYHPAPRIVIDISGGNDPAVAADLQRALRNRGYWPVRHCYEAGLRRDQRLAGRVSLELAMDAATSTFRAVSSPGSPAPGSGLSDPVVAACIAREVGALVVTSDKAPAAASPVRADVSLGTGDEPVAVAAPVQDAERLREVLRMSWPDLQRCYARAREADGRAGGRLELHFRDSADGLVTQLDEGEPRFATEGMTPCVLAVYRVAKLPPCAPARPERAFVYALQFEVSLVAEPGSP